MDPLADSYESWSPYNYVLGNPISLIDPDGRAPTSTTNGDPPFRPEDVTVAGIFYEAYVGARAATFNFFQRGREWLGYGEEGVSKRMTVQHDKNGAVYWHGGKNGEITTQPRNSVLDEAKAIGWDLLSLTPALELKAGNGVFLAAKAPSSIIPSIARQFGNLDCVPCADAIKSALKGEGISGEIVTLQANSSKRGFIYSETGIKGEHIISKSGLHRGILVDGKMYDNIHTDGINYQDWLNDFDVLGGFQEPIRTGF